MSMSLQIALAAEIHLADRLTLKLWLTTNVEKPNYSSRYLYTDLYNDNAYDDDNNNNDNNNGDNNNNNNNNTQKFVLGTHDKWVLLIPVFMW
jgi:hypothetical protein